jgi:hypothetical protein
MQVQGIVIGRYIELFQEIDLPDGQAVTVDIHPKALSLEEKRKIADKLCGSWAVDNTLCPIFKEIEQSRRDNLSRKVEFDAAS